MPRVLETLSDVLFAPFDTLIDVRSPAEFAEDHMPGAINLPALSNAERAEVGTIYKQVSPFDARKIGASLVARNVADHIAGPLADKDGGWRPLVYCWRGGQRSGSFATILQQIGWRAETVQGGYQSYRKLVHRMLYENPLPHRIVLLDGNTGTAKTEILAQLPGHGVQVVDLEGLARHRGSLLGGMDEGQPSQKAFESGLAAALSRCDPEKITVLEAESSKIGRLILPERLWHAMCAAPRIVISAPLAARGAYLQTAYADVIAAPDRLKDRLSPLRRVRGHAQVDEWEALIEAGDFLTLAESLMATHYDPAYARSRRIDTRALIGEVSAETLDAAGIASATADVARLIGQL